MHVLTFLFTMINVSETQEYTVTCIIYSQSELVFGHVYSVAIALDLLMSNALASIDPLWHDHCEPLHYFHLC